MICEYAGGEGGCQHINGISGVGGLGEGLRNTQYSLGAPASHPDQHHRAPNLRALCLGSNWSRVHRAPSKALWSAVASSDVCSAFMAQNAALTHCHPREHPCGSGWTMCGRDNLRHLFRATQKVEKPTDLGQAREGLTTHSYLLSITLLFPKHTEMHVCVHICMCMDTWICLCIHTHTHLCTHCFS